jgi:hypothetical protein
MGFLSLTAAEADAFADELRQMAEGVRRQRRELEQQVARHSRQSDAVDDQII